MFRFSNVLFRESLLTSDLLFYYSIHTKTENVHMKCTFSCSMFCEMQGKGRDFDFDIDE